MLKLLPCGYEDGEKKGLKQENETAVVQLPVAPNNRKIFTPTHYSVDGCGREKPTDNVAHRLSLLTWCSFFSFALFSLLLLP